MLCLIGLALGNGGNDGDKAAEGQGSPATPMGISALQFGWRDPWGFDVGVLVRCYQESSASQCFEAVDAPPTFVPPQGRTPTAAAGESETSGAGLATGAAGSAEESSGYSGASLPAVNDAPGGLGGSSGAGSADEISYESYLSAVSYSVLGEIVAAYDWPINEAFRIVDCESSWDALAVSWAGARGLMQLMPVHAWRFARRGWDYWVDVFVPERNVAIGYELYLEQAWRPWLCA